MTMIYFDVKSKFPLGSAKPKATLPRLLKDAHVVSLHVTQRASAESLMGDEEIAQLRQGAMLINVSCVNVVI